MDLEKQAALTAILSDPDILRAHAPALARRIAEGIMSVPGAVVLGDIDGIVVLYPEGDGKYDAHWLMPPWTRGAAAAARGRAAIREMFVGHGAAAIRGQTPKGNRAARLMNRMVGMVPVGECVNSEGQDCIQYELTREAFERTMAPCSSGSPK